MKCVVYVMSAYNRPVTPKTLIRKENKLRKWGDITIRLDMLLKEIQAQNGVNSIYDTLYPRICNE